ncbi:nose resistant to fluoxetine protein 6 [Aethina tumida]|uniref:nose resistant to fluoxetine protein 6 n=1 Tax=Aethina tumida TaxID=116153 RepID=UPI00214957D2|nr:nose resistant to fluoxetine protein 6 [Aethina tumida]
MVPTSESYKILLKLLGSIRQIQDDIKQHLNDNLCYNQLYKVINFDMSSSERWILEMLDATAKPQSGLLYGNVMHLGNYDECLSISEGEVQGKYCTVFLGASTQILTTTWGVCLPSSCNESLIQPLFDRIHESQLLPFPLTISNDFCKSNVDAEPLLSGNIIGICVFAFFGILMVAATFVDYFMNLKSKENTRIRILLSFSIYTNGKKIFKTKTNDGTMGCLNGLRVISMAWILFAHGHLFAFFVPSINMITLPDFVKAWFGATITSASMAVDTFFVISGLLVVYLYLKTFEKTGKMSLMMFYIHRILRLTPSLIMVIILSTFILRPTGSGPFYNLVLNMIETSCKDNWWVTLIYLQNYIHPKEMCIAHSWYLAVDTQLYFLAPILIIGLIRWPKKTLVTSVIILLLSCIFSFTFTWTNNYVAAFFNMNSDIMKDIYTPTHVRCTPWIVGAIFGYLLFKLKDKQIKLTTTVVTTLWCITFLIMFGIVVHHKQLSEAELKATTETMGEQISSSFYNGFDRPIWAIAICCLIFLCVHGYGGVINTILSAPIFNVLIRVNYSMYLLHMIILFYIYGQKRTPEYFGIEFKLIECFGIFTITLFISILWTLAFESPIVALEKIIFSKKEHKSHRNGTSHLENNMINSKPGDFSTNIYIVGNYKKNENVCI